MILEELNEEIDKRSNDLVIEYIAKLLERDSCEWFSHFDIDKDLNELVGQFRLKLSQYVYAKKEHHRYAKHYNDVDHCIVDKLEYKWRCLQVEKNDLKKKLIEASVNYKQFQKQ